MKEDIRLQNALRFAEQKHKGQLRLGGQPYISHPIAVAEIVKSKGYGIDYQITALFHDLLEDTDASEQEILELGGETVLKAVKLLTKTQDYVMEEYVAGIRRDPIAFAVKGADRLHNLKSAVCADKDFRRRYILETIDWYLDFLPEMPEAVRELADTLDAPLRSLSLDYQPVVSGELKLNSFVLKGDVCFSRSAAELVTVRGGYAVCVNGISKGVFEQLPKEYSELPVYDYGSRLIIPGLVDLHTHAPQYAFRGTAMDLPLMEWLSEQVFAQEAKYADTDYAKKAYSIFAEDMKASATTHACIFATKHRQATELLMDCMEKTGIVSFVGKVNMDREAPPILCDPSADYSAFDTFGWINSVKDKYQRTKPILSPRFIPCCSPKLLEELREIQIAYDLPVQSHLSESPEEVAFVKELCKNADFYGDAYDDYGLFGREHRSEKPVRTIMAHCVYSSEAEIERLKSNGVFVAHCPASNSNLSSGIAPIRRYMERGLKIGLGSDVAGGHTLSMLHAVCDTVQVSKLYWRIIDSAAAPLNFREAFYLATKGGGAFFGKVGSFEEGYEFNAVVMDDGCLATAVEMNVEQRLERGAYSSLDLHGISAKYVYGKKLFDKIKNDGE